ncbi:MerR family transcriptional regulator [Fluviibacterium sp. DFM31]|uniref:MerR family transcriptional regulator n=1 Tax=Meridianimarinicoccus marinus TaxID=3231483 RepID=A0ABV3L211_9RHOB
MRKSAEAFRTISEVARWLDTPAHVLRFWESRFPEIAPVKRAGGRRYYRPDDMRLLGGIKHLLHTEGHTIKSVQERLQTEGTVAIAAFSPSLDLKTDGDAAAAPETSDSVTPPAATPTADTTPSPQTDVSGEDPAPGEIPIAAQSEDIPPIGFFFDDSEDADPAEDQSGTFASSQMPPPEDRSDPADVAAPEAAMPVEVPPLAPVPYLPGTSHALRALVPADLPAAHRAALRDAATRLQALHSRPW